MILTKGPRNCDAYVLNFYVIVKGGTRLSVVGKWIPVATQQRYKQWQPAWSASTWKEAKGMWAEHWPHQLQSPMHLEIKVSFED